MPAASRKPGRPLTDEEKQRISGVSSEYGALAQLARELGRPINTLSGHLRSRGVPPRQLWSSQEDRILIAHRGKSDKEISAYLLSAGFVRSPGAVSERKRRLRMTISPDRNGDYSAQAVAQGLGSTVTTVTAWIRRGWLRACRPAGKDLRSGPAWTITAGGLREFIIHYTAHVDFGRTDKYFLTDILTGCSVAKAASKEGNS